MDYDFLPMSDGNGDVVVMPITVARSIAGANITVSPHTNIPTKFIAATGTQLANGMLDPTKTIQVFKGHWNGSVIVIDAFEPGTTDAGNTTLEVVVFKPITGWFNRVARFVRNITNQGAATVTLMHSWTITTKTSQTDLTSSGSTRTAGIVFSRSRGPIDHANFFLGYNTTPVATSAVVTAQVYAVESPGTKVGLQRPTGSALATSDPLTADQISALPAASNGITTAFTFSGANRITLSYNTRYAILVRFTSGTGTLRVYLNAPGTKTPNRANKFTGNASDAWTSTADSTGLYCSEVYTAPSQLDDVTFDDLVAPSLLVQGAATANKFIQPTAAVLDGRTNAAYRYNVTPTDLSNGYATVNIPHGLTYVPRVSGFLKLSSTAAPADPTLPLTLPFPYKNFQNKSYVATYPACSGTVLITSIDATNITVRIDMYDSDFSTILSANHFLIFHFFCRPRPAAVT